jgi:hypothetical protein
MLKRDDQKLEMAEQASRAKETFGQYEPRTARH